jgi:hypothetical protein
MRILLLGHLGIGDHIVMNGIVHFLQKDIHNLEEICILAVDDYRKETLIHMYEDYPLVTFHFIQLPLELDPLFLQAHMVAQKTNIIFNEKVYTCINFGLHSQIRSNWIFPNMDWVQSIYKYPLNLDASIRINEFRLPSNMNRAVEKYQTLLKTLNTSEYIIIHDDPSRKRFIDREIVSNKLREDGMTNLPLLYLGKDRYKYPLLEGFLNPDVNTLLECTSLFDLYYILKYARACHVMDSSIACLIDCSNIHGKLYVHNYIMKDTGKQFKRIPWVQIHK